MASTNVTPIFNSQTKLHIHQFPAVSHQTTENSEVEIPKASHCQNVHIFLFSLFFFLTPKLILKPILSQCHNRILPSMCN